MVFDTLGVDRRGRLIDAEFQEEPVNQLMPLLAFARQSPAPGGEFDGLIRLGGDKALPLKAADDLDGGERRRSERGPSVFLSRGSSRSTLSSLGPPWPLRWMTDTALHITGITSTRCGVPC